MLSQFQRAIMVCNIFNYISFPVKKGAKGVSDTQQGSPLSLRLWWADDKFNKQVQLKLNLNTSKKNSPYLEEALSHRTISSTQRASSALYTWEPGCSLMASPKTLMFTLAAHLMCTTNSLTRHTVCLSFWTKPCLSGLPVFKQSKKMTFSIRMKLNHMKPSLQ